MKQILLDRYGQPEEGLRCADVPDVGAPGAGEVVFEVLAFPINPADISFCPAPTGEARAARDARSRRRRPRRRSAPA